MDVLSIFKEEDQKLIAEFSREAGISEEQLVRYATRRYVTQLINNLAK